jgi:hypothetical protein
LEEGFEECEHVSHTRGPGPLLARPFAVTLRPHAVLQAAQSTSAAAPPRKRPCKGVSGPPLASPTRSGRPRGGRRGCRGGGQVTNSRSHTPRPGPASQTAGAGPHLIVTSLALAASESTRTQFTIYRSVFFFVLCNQHRFNSIPGPPPRDELGCTHIYPPPLAQTLAMPTYP